MRLQSKTALITGAGQGIGLGIARRFLQEGARVMLAEQDPEAGRQAEADLSALGSVRFMETDVADEIAVRAVVDATVAQFGGLDILVNNAGISANGPLRDLDLADWNRVLGVNLTGPMLLAKHAQAALSQSRGSIINITSTRAFMSEADTEAYSAGKGGLVALTHALAVSLGPQVRVNAIAPGWIEVGDWQKPARRRQPRHSREDRLQHPAGRVGTPEDIAALAVLLASPEESGFITGACFTVDGGMTRKMIYV